MKRVFLVHGENDSRAALKRAILARVVEGRDRDRSIAAVELPEPVSGWFDLLKNEWVYESHPVVDRQDIQLAALLAEVNRLSAKVAKLEMDPPDAEASNKLQAELAEAGARLVGLG